MGYNLIERGSQKICAIGRNQNGECPVGTYFDGQYGACVSPTAGADVPYGIDEPAGAEQAYQGCAAGYSYDSQYQCCQATVGGAYPGCAVGFTFDSNSACLCPPAGQCQQSRMRFGHAEYCTLHAGNRRVRKYYL